MLSKKWECSEDLITRKAFVTLLTSMYLNVPLLNNWWTKSLAAVCTSINTSMLYNMTLQKCWGPKFFITLQTNCHIVDTYKTSHQCHALMDQQNIYHSMNIYAGSFVCVCVQYDPCSNTQMHTTYRNEDTWMASYQNAVFHAPCKNFFYKCLFTNLALVRVDPYMTFDFSMQI